MMKIDGLDSGTLATNQVRFPGTGLYIPLSASNGLQNHTDAVYMLDQTTNKQKDTWANRYAVHQRDHLYNLMKL